MKSLLKSSVTGRVLVFIGLGIPPLVFADSPIKNVQGIINLLDKIVQWVQAIFWTVAIIMIFYAAYLFLTARGEPETVKKAKNQLLYAVIAIAIALMAFGFKPLIEDFLKAGGSSAPSGPPANNYIPL